MTGYLQGNYKTYHRKTFLIDSSSFLEPLVGFTSCLTAYGAAQNKCDNNRNQPTTIHTSFPPVWMKLMGTLNHYLIQGFEKTCLFRQSIRAGRQR